MDCPSCGRQFKKSNSLHQHCRDKHPKTYCFRCQRPFALRDDLRRHVKMSSNHHRCDECQHHPDFETASELCDHRVQKHFCCTNCEKGFGSSASLQQHDVAVHNLCVVCGNFFDSPSNLINHQRVHAPKNTPCLGGCNQMFDRDSAMLLHLEAGTCPSGINVQVINACAQNCDESASYRSTNEDWEFCCPGCKTPFAKMSGVFQHSESRFCESPGGEAALDKFLLFLRAFL
ncbi:hypothetical protein QBC34DRAFT_323304 [Podospora aff. communis PSN243]|uniref:C2H2-type domain-containing protein n=1 Tax=Podospora aff. communis PSN243 TaxID=3040156 RepID=A0AAV9GRD2_9PEZI|nr:hypothetical protein QBC34DRAFT_323304 [Podospora aff. communis PSN243]